MAARDLSEQDLVNSLSKQHGVPSVDLDREAPTLVVAMADPGDVAIIDELQRRTGFSVEVVVAAASRVRRAIDRYYFAN